VTRLTAMLAAGTFLLAAADGTSSKDGVVEVPAALNPDKLSIFRVVSATGVQVYTCTRNPAGATGWILKGPDARLCRATIKVRQHIASSSNAPHRWTVASSVMFPLPHAVDAKDDRSKRAILLFDPRREHSSVPTSVIQAPSRAAAVKDGRARAATRRACP